MSFTLDLSRIVNKAGGQVESATRKITIELFSKVILKSPVDTGRFRANWIYSINGYEPVTSELTDKAGASAVARMTSAVSSARLGGQLYLTNSLPYALRLENGWSKQAPSGMVKLSLLEAQAKYGT